MGVASANRRTLRVLKFVRRSTCALNIWSWTDSLPAIAIRIADAVQNELARLLGEQGLPSAIKKILAGGVFEWRDDLVKSRCTSRRIGSQIAHAVHRAFTNGESENLRSGAAAPTTMRASGETIVDGNTVQSRGESERVTAIARTGLTGILQRKCGWGSPTSSLTDGCPACASKKRLQTKLSIGANNDPLEREADRIADQVLAAPTHPAVSGGSPAIHRYAGQAGVHTADTAPASVDRALTSPGNALDPLYGRIWNIASAMISLGCGSIPARLPSVRPQMSMLRHIRSVSTLCLAPVGLRRKPNKDGD